MSVTVERLQNLRPGESMIYYRGHLDKDIAFSCGAYAALLDAVRSTAVQMAADVKLVLEEREAIVEVRAQDGADASERVSIIEYIARRP